MIKNNQRIRQSLVDVLKPEKIIVQDYVTAMEFYRDDRDSTPCIVISELHPRGMTGIELAEKLAADKKDLLFALLVGDGHGDAAVAVKAMQGHVFNFSLKPVSAVGLRGLVALSYAQYYDVDWSIVGDDLECVKERLNRLTVREREVLEPLVEGRSTRKLATLLDLSTKTIDAHRARINDKMRSNDLAHLVRMVMASRDV